MSDAPIQAEPPVTADEAGLDSAPVKPPPTGIKALLFHPVTKFLLKLAVAAGLLTWLALSDRLDFTTLWNPGNDWAWIASSALLLLPTIGYASLRYKILLDGLGMPCTFKRALTWTMIGQFFNVAMPSATGGDVVKAYYVVSAYPREHRAMAVLSVLLDRVLGLFGLFFLALLVCLLGGHTVSDNPRLANTTTILIAVCCGVVAGFTVLVSRNIEQNALRKRLFLWLPFGAKIEKLYMSFASLRRRPGLVAGTLLLSMFNHAFLTASMLALAFGVRMDFIKDELVGAMIVIPLCNFFKIFGVAGGFGTEYATEVLFREILRAPEKAGTNLMFAFNIIGFGISMLGLPVYLITGKARPHGEIEASPPPVTAP